MVNSLHPGKFHTLFCRLLIFFKINFSEKFFQEYHQSVIGPRSPVGNVSGNRCKSDCRSRGREFDPGPVPYFRGD